MTCPRATVPDVVHVEGVVQAKLEAVVEERFPIRPVEFQGSPIAAGGDDQESSIRKPGESDDADLRSGLDFRGQRTWVFGIRNVVEHDFSFRAVAHDTFERHREDVAAELDAAGVLVLGEDESLDDPIVDRGLGSLNGVGLFVAIGPQSFANGIPGSQPDDEEMASVPVGHAGTGDKEIGLTGSRGPRDALVMGAGAIQAAGGVGSRVRIMAEPQQIGVRSQAVELVLDVGKPAVGFVEVGFRGWRGERNHAQE